MSTSIADSDPIAMTDAEQRLGTKAHRFTATYERSINKAGTPVRRLVLTGPEEVDGAALRERDAA